MERLVFNDALEPFYCVNNVISGEDEFKVEQRFNPAPYAENVEFVVSSTSKNYMVVEGSLLSKDGTILYAHPSAPADGVFRVLDSVKILGWWCMFSNEGITHIELPAGLQRIEDYAMAYTGIDELIMPDSVTEVQGYICYKCPNLKKVVIGDSLKELGQQVGWNCFYECTSLEELTLGSSLEIIGNGSFAYSKIKNLHIPDSVKQINFVAFGECAELSEVTGGPGLIRINRLAFCSDIALTSFPLETSDSYQYISAKAFEGCVFPLSVPDHLTVSDTGDYVRYDASLVFEGELLYSEAYDVFDLVNEERSKQGLSAISMDEELLDAAFQRAAEFVVSFSHARPSGDSCFTVSGKAYAENVAMGQWDAASAMASWMNSSGHRANILGESWESIGVGAFRQGGTIYWVQLFGPPSQALPLSQVMSNGA